MVSVDHRAKELSGKLRFLFCIGDILVFMPGQEDIEVTCELIKGLKSFI